MEITSRSSNRITVDTAALSHNYRLIRSTLPEGVKLLAMVKGDGYGHGMIEAARAFARAGCTIFGVAELCEGVRLRQAGITGEIFIMVGFPREDAEVFFECNLTPVVFAEADIELLSRLAVERKRVIELHLKVDTGMGRLGVEPEEVPQLIQRIDTLDGVRLGGIVSHFSQADDPSSSQTAQAFALFNQTCKTVGQRLEFDRHIANSGAVLNFPETLCEMGRAGIALYGYSPAGQPLATGIGGEFLRPAMRFSTRVMMVKTVGAGRGISYGHTYVTTRTTRLAVLPVGYEDGYPRCLSSKGEVLIRGCRAPIVGRVCMNLCMVDITEIDGVEPGDEAVLLGEQGAECITADDIAEKAGTISYEILCMLGNNNERDIVE